ncbi:hypothetical protein OH76DRAFT_763228 [Lentinus brumalis]|uniref:Hydrophobin n=1 Tax=Lentinus brumalis TaxID=2498619 RepID=A0A371DT24_9APHY|nr:hypothetical protein OH76DRAFT_763228 [Polyporus brumalis]
MLMRARVLVCLTFSLLCSPPSLSPHPPLMLCCTVDDTRTLLVSSILSIAVGGQRVLCCSRTVGKDYTRFRSPRLLFARRDDRHA